MLNFSKHCSCGISISYQQGLHRHFGWQMYPPSTNRYLEQKVKASLGTLQVIHHSTEDSFGKLCEPKSICYFTVPFSNIQQKSTWNYNFPLLLSFFLFSPLKFILLCTGAVSGSAFVSQLFILSKQ